MAKSKHKYKNCVADIAVFQNNILRWYDSHKRDLPWRCDRPDPYPVWLSEIMLQQTTVTAVKPYFEKFMSLWPRVHDLAAAPQEEVMHAWAGLGYYSRARNLHKAARIITHEYGGHFPNTLEGLKALPGVGDYTAAAIAAIAFHREEVVIDGNIERIFSRYLAIEDEFPKAKKDLKRVLPPYFLGLNGRAGDFAQALMDIGSAVCSPKSPSCGVCPVAGGCLAYQAGTMLDYPRKSPKKKRPSKRGYVYFIRNEAGDVMVERRPETGLLAQTLGFPTSDWREDGAAVHPDFISDIAETPHSIRHVFTHFDLDLTLCTACVAPVNNYRWEALDSRAMQGLPSLFNKVYKKILKTV